MGLVEVLLILVVPQFTANVQTMPDEIDLEGLKRLCYPEEFSRTDTIYTTKEPYMIGSYLETMECLGLSLHISVYIDNGYRESYEVSLDHLYRCNFTEFWLTSPPGSLEVTIKYNKLTELQLQKLTSFHIKVPIETVGDLVSIIRDMQHLEVLELAGTRRLAKVDISGILAALNGKPLKVLKLNGFQYPGSIQNEDMIQAIHPLDFFQPLSSAPLMCLEMCNNYLTYINHGFYDVLPNVRIFNVSCNYIYDHDYITLEFLLNPIMEVLDISGQGLSSFNPLAKDCLAPWSDKPGVVNDKRHPEVLRVRRNDEHDITCSQPNISSDCHQMKCAMVKTFKQRSILNVSCSVLPSFQTLLSLIDFSCTPPIKIPLGKNLKVIKAGFSTVSGQFYPPSGHQRVCFHKNNLTEVSLTHNSMVSNKLHYSFQLYVIEVSGLNHLTLVDFSFSGMDIILPDLLLLKSVTSLERLFIQGNNISFNFSAGEGLCDIYPNLKEINLSESNISTIDTTLYSGCNGNLNYVDLSHNGMDDLFDISSMTSHFYIDTINLTYNNIKYISKKTQEFLNNYGSHENLKFDLSANNFVCDCSEEALGTVKLIQNSQDRGVNFLNREDYVCLATYHTAQYRLIMNINLDEARGICFPSHVSQILMGTTAICVIVTLTCLMSLIWKYRFRIATRFYRIKLKLLCRGVKHNVFVYDAFVAYCSKDRMWVHNVLMKTLEETYGFNLCIHYRDFLLGEFIADEIVYHMSKSRCNIIVLSDRFLLKQWPAFELERATTERFLKSKKMIVIKFGKISSKHVSGLVKEILDADAYMEWPQDQSGKKPFKTIQKKQELFLAKLAAMLYDRGCCCHMQNMCCRHQESNGPIDDEITAMVNI